MSRYFAKSPTAPIKSPTTQDTFIYYLAIKEVTNICVVMSEVDKCARKHMEALQ